jgi:hypothetical protein
MFHILTSKGWDASSDRVGFHIHTTKEAWKPFQIYKLLQFMYNQKHRTFIEFIAGRKLNRFCSIDKVDVTNAKHIAKHKKNLVEEHYAAVNMLGPRTIEFRIFAGTLEFGVFMKNMEFVKAMFDFTRNCSIKLMNLSGFKKFISNNKKHYFYLYTYLKAGKEI